MNPMHLRFFSDSTTFGKSLIAIPIAHHCGVKQILRLSLDPNHGSDIGHFKLIEASPKTAFGVPSKQFRDHPSAKVFTITGVISVEPKLIEMSLMEQFPKADDDDPEWREWDGLTVVRVVWYRPSVASRSKRTLVTASYVFRGNQLLAVEGFESYKEVCSRWDSVTPGFSNVKSSKIVSTYRHNGLIYVTHHAPNHELLLSAHYRPSLLAASENVADWRFAGDKAIDWRFGVPYLSEVKQDEAQPT